MSIEQYVLFTKFMMETVFLTYSRPMYVDPNLQRYGRAMTGRAGNRDGGRYFQKMVNSWLSSFIYRVLKLCLQRFRDDRGGKNKHVFYLTKLWLKHRFAARWSYR